MKNVFGILIILAGIACGVSVPTQAQSYIWECQWSSVDALGRGLSPSRSTASRIALHECRLRTASWNQCFFDGCR